MKYLSVGLFFILIILAIYCYLKIFDLRHTINYLREVNIVNRQLMNESCVNLGDMKRYLESRGLSYDLIEYEDAISIPLDIDEAEIESVVSIQGLYKYEKTDEVYIFFDKNGCSIWR